MKKILKKFFFMILLIISIVFLPYNVNALSTNYKNINEEIVSLNDDNSSFQFKNVNFKNWSNLKYPSFGLGGVVYNGNNYDVSFLAIATYYDSNYNLIATTYDNQFIPAGQYNSYSHMSNLSEIKSGYTANDIAYYKLDIEINKKETINNNSSITNNNSDSIIPSQNNNYKSYDYVIDKYNIDIVVNENNTFDITETITAYFNVPKHGIYRTLPFKNSITRLDGTVSKNKVQISNLSVNNKYKTSRENGNYKIKIGSANKTLTGEQTYVIKYTYNIGKDPLKNKDELYYNIIGTDWDTVIGNISFSITMPKEFDEKLLGFSAGTQGSTNSNNVNYTVEGNKITGNYNGVLGVGEALTVRTDLPEGYFVGAGLNINFIDYIILLIPISFLGIAIYLWYKFGRDDQVVEIVEFYPPEGFNSLEVGLLYKGKAGNKDVTSLLIYLANKGYIKISETEEKFLFTKIEDFKITKLKEYDGDNVNEQIFLNGLFNEDTLAFADNKNEVTSSDLSNKFYITMDKILLNINNKENKNKIFEKSASEKSIIIILMIIATHCLINIPSLFACEDVSALIAGLVCELFMPALGFSFIYPFISGEPNYSKSFLFFMLILGFLPGIGIALPIYLKDPIYLVRYIIGLICLVGMAICSRHLRKRTPFGNEMLGKIKGFRSFLETVEKDKLEAMVMQDPAYFYNILPFTYVLGISNKWIEKFETISLPPPSWYGNSTGFSIETVEHFMNSTMASVQSAMLSNPADDSRSESSSGGGSSGGGSGGGGGGSW